MKLFCKPSVYVLLGLVYSQLEAGTCDSTWQSNANANWSVPANWGQATCYPGQTDPSDMATFDGTGTVTTISVDLAATPVLQTINLLNDTYTINGPNTIGFGAAAPFDRIIVLNNSHTINAPMSTGTNTLHMFVVNFSSQLKISGAVNANINQGTVVLTGDGIINGGTIQNLNNAFNGLTGGFYCNNFTVAPLILDAGTFNNLNTNAVSLPGAVGSLLDVSNLNFDPINTIVAPQFLIQNNGNVTGTALAGSAVVSILNGSLSGTGSVKIENAVNNPVIINSALGTAVGALMILEAASISIADLEIINHAGGSVSGVLTGEANFGALLVPLNATISNGSILIKNQGAVGTVNTGNCYGALIGNNTAAALPLNITGGSIQAINDSTTNLVTSGSINRPSFGSGIFFFGGANQDINISGGTHLFKNMSGVSTGGIGTVLGTIANMTLSGGDVTLQNDQDLNPSSGGALGACNSFSMSGGQLTLINNGDISINSAGVTFDAGQITQTAGTVTVTNAGTLSSGAIGSIISVNSFYDISGGLLNNNDTVQALNLNLTSTGVVAGNGQFIGTPTIIFSNAGTVIPGGPTIGGLPGVMSITGTYNQQPNGTLVINLLHSGPPGPNTSSQLNVTGTANLAGFLEVAVGPGQSIQLTDVYTILLASGGVNGQFDPNIINFNLPPGFTPFLTYEPNAVLLSFLQSNRVICCPCPNLCEFVDLSQTIFASITEINNFFVKRQTQRIQQKLNCEKDCVVKKWDVYIGPTGSFGDADERKNLASYDYWSAGALIGADYTCDVGGMGIMAVYERIDGDGDDHWGDFDINRAHGTLYGTFVPKQAKSLAIDAAIGGGYDWYEIKRETPSGKAKGSPNGYEYDAFVSLEYTLSWKNINFIPMANVQYAHLHIQSYDEHDASIYDFDFESQNIKSLTSVLGAFANKMYQWEKRTLTVTANLGWQREYLNKGRNIEYSRPTAFSRGLCLCCEDDIRVGEAKRNGLLAGLDLLLSMNEKLSLEAAYDLVWNSKFDSNRFFVGLHSNF